MTTQSEEIEKTKRIHRWLGIIFGASLIVAVALSCLTLSYLTDYHWFSLAGICISSFLLSLVCMDYMTYKARTKLNKEAGARRREIEELKNKEKTSSLTQNEQTKLSQLEKELEDLEALPLADRIALIFPEPIEVLDRHEIRRALVISLTIVYFILLFQESSMMQYFTLVYLSVIAFYFGSRALEKYAEVRKATERA